MLIVKSKNPTTLTINIAFNNPISHKETIINIILNTILIIDLDKSFNLHLFFINNL